VIGRALRELFVSTRTWRHEELLNKTASDHALLKGNTGALIHTDHIGVTTVFPLRASRLERKTRSKTDLRR
jgi:hypothetical protein